MLGMTALSTARGWGEGGAPHRRPLLGGDAGDEGRLCIARGGAGGATPAREVDGDRIGIDAAAGSLSLVVPVSELRTRKARTPRRSPVVGVLAKYAAQVGSAHLGAVTGPPRAGKKS